MATTQIEWTHLPRGDGTFAPGYTYNPWRGCTKVSAGCDHCYAEHMSGSNPKVLGVWGKQGARAPASASYLRMPHGWNEEASRLGEVRLVFCASLADVFEGAETCPKESYGLIEDLRLRLFRTIDATPSLRWLLLTKRPQNVRKFWSGGHRPNVWLGASVEDQASLDRRFRWLAGCRDLCRHLFLSAEPLLGPIDLVPYAHAIDWVICGGESGSGSRPFDLSWARSIRDQCGGAGVKFFMKQMGAAPLGMARVGRKTDDMAYFPPDLRVREYPDWR